MTMILAPDSSVEQPTTSEATAPNPFQSPKRTDAAASHDSISYTPVYSSDEEDDSRDRQSHWKRIKTRSDDNNPPGNNNGRNLIRWTERDRHSNHNNKNNNNNNNNSSYDASPVRRRPLQTLRSSIPSPKKSSNPARPVHRMIVLKSKLHDRHPSGHELSQGSLDVAMGRGGFKDGGTASKDMDAGLASKRKFEISMNIDMYKRSMSLQEQHMARRGLPVERGHTDRGYEVRVCRREEGEFDGEDDDDDDDDGLFLEDSHPVEAERPRITVDLREALNRRTTTRGGVVPDVVCSGRGYDGDDHHPGVGGHHQTRERGFDVKVRVRKVAFDLSFEGASSQARSTSEVRKQILPNDERGQSFPSRASAAAVAATSKAARDTDAERRQEKRERWAEKERDFERDLQKELQKQEAAQKQQQPQQQQQQQTMAKPKSLTVVDYSHKFTVAKAPLGVPVKPVESDPHRLCQRQKQIDYGKNTLGYERYTEMVPRYQRTKVHPRTPDIRQVCSKRSWDGQIRKWRRLLHEYDPPKEDDDEDPDQMFAPTSEHDVGGGIIRGAAVDGCVMDMQPELVVEDADLKIYDGWSDEEC